MTFARAAAATALRSCTVVAAGGLLTSGAARTDAQPARTVGTSPAAGDCKKLQINVGINRTVFEAREKAHALLKDMPPIPELAYKPTARYAESTKEAVLHPLTTSEFMKKSWKKRAVVIHGQDLT